MNAGYVLYRKGNDYFNIPIKDRELFLRRYGADNVEEIESVVFHRGNDRYNIPAKDVKLFKDTYPDARIAFGMDDVIPQSRPENRDPRRSFIDDSIGNRGSRSFIQDEDMVQASNEESDIVDLSQRILSEQKRQQELVREARIEELRQTSYDVAEQHGAVGRFTLGVLTSAVAGTGSGVFGFINYNLMYNPLAKRHPLNKLANAIGIDTEMISGELSKGMAALDKGYMEKVDEEHGMAGVMGLSILSNILAMVMSAGASRTLSVAGLSTKAAGYIGTGLAFGVPAMGRKHTEIQTDERTDDIAEWRKALSPLVTGVAVTLTEQLGSINLMKKNMKLISKANLSKEFAKETAKRVGKNMLGEAFEEFVEEWIDYFNDRFLLLNDELTLEEGLYNSLQSALAGAIGSLVYFGVFGGAELTHRIGKTNVKIDGQDINYFVDTKAYKDNPDFYEEQGRRFMRGDPTYLNTPEIREMLKKGTIYVGKGQLEVLSRLEDNAKRNTEQALYKMSEIEALLNSGGFYQDPNMALYYMDNLIANSEDFVDSQTIKEMKETRNEIKNKIREAKRNGYNKKAGEYNTLVGTHLTKIQEMLTNINNKLPKREEPLKSWEISKRIERSKEKKTEQTQYNPIEDYIKLKHYIDDALNEIDKFEFSDDHSLLLNKPGADGARSILNKLNESIKHNKIETVFNDLSLLLDGFTKVEFKSEEYHNLVAKFSDKLSEIFNN